MDPTEAHSLVDEAWRAHGSEVHDYLARMCGNRHVAEDLTAETFLRLLRWLQVPDQEAPRQTIGWLKVVARRLLVDHYRCGVTRFEVPSASPLRSAACIEAADLFAEAESDVAQILAPLTERQRTVVVLRGFQDMTTADTARHMGVTEQAVRSLRWAAKRRLRAVYGDTPAWALEAAG